MRAVVVFYKGEELANLTKSLIAKTLIDSGVPARSIEMVELSEEEVANAVTVKTVHILPNKTIEQTKEEEVFKHAYNYVSGIVGKNLSDIRFNTKDVVAFIVACTKHIGDERFKKAFEIIQNASDELKERYVPKHILEAIKTVTVNNLI